MLRRPSRSTRTDTLFPYPSLFRSPPGAQVTLELAALVRPAPPAATTVGPAPLAGVLSRLQGQWPVLQQTLDAIRAADPALAQRLQDQLLPQPNARLAVRSEERRVGKECSVRVDLGGRRIIKKKTEQ